MDQLADGGTPATVQVSISCTVCEHGARADGVHDDAPSFQAALGACTLVDVPAAGCGAASIDAPVVYLVGPVTIPADRTLVLDGNITTLPPSRWPLEGNKTLTSCTVQTCRYIDLFSGHNNTLRASLQQLTTPVLQCHHHTDACRRHPKGRPWAVSSRHTRPQFSRLVGERLELQNDLRGRSRVAVQPRPSGSI